MNGRTVAALAAAAVVVVIVVLLETSGTNQGAGTGSDGGPAPAIPLASSVTSTKQSSVILAMGHLDDPPNTFWQLFLRPSGNASWSLSTPPGVADNGGLVVAAPASGPLTAGFLTSADLKFSPVAQTPDSGSTWLPGSLPAALIAVPDAIAAGAGSDLWAIVSGDTVEASTGDLSTWNPVVTTHDLATSVAGCPVVAVTAVAAGPVGRPLLGVSCAHGSQIGVLETGSSDVGSTVQRWQDIGPQLGGGDSGASTSVLRLEQTADGIAGLAEVKQGGVWSLVAFWGAGTSNQWSQSAPVGVPAGWAVEATGIGGGGGQGGSVVLGSGTRRQVEVIPGPGGGWTAAPPAPNGTAAVAVIGSETDAFVPAGSRLTVWTCPAGAAGWTRTATITVPIQYGSSN